MGYAGLVTSWLSLEYIHLSCEWWELSFPWLNLGNGLAALVPFIQWYEYTGILGGTLWILLANILLYHVLFEQHPVKILSFNSIYLSFSLSFI